MIQRMDALENISSRMEAWIGLHIQITECITRDAPSRNRHSSTLSSFSMELEGIGFQISGAQISIRGMNEESYGVSIDSLVDWDTTQEREIYLTERFAPSVERYTTITLLS